MALDPEIIRGAIGHVTHWLSRGWNLTKALVGLLENRNYQHLTPSQRQRALKMGQQNFNAWTAFQSGRALTVGMGYPASAVPAGGTIGVRVFIESKRRGGPLLEQSITMNVLSNWTMEQIMESARAFYNSGGLVRRSGGLSDLGIIRDIKIYQLISGGLDSPALDTTGGV